MTRNSSSALHILVISNLFPNDQEVIKGIWIKELVLALSNKCHLTIISPVPFFPHICSLKRWSKYSQIPDEAEIGQIKIYYPRYLAIPKWTKSQLGFSFFLAGFSFFLTLMSCIVIRLRPNKLQNFDLIHAHTVFPDGFAAILLGKLLGKKVILTAHGSTLRDYYRDRAIKGILVRYTLKTSELVISPHPELTEILDRLDCKRIEIPNGLDTKKFNPTYVEEVEIVRRKLNLHNKKIVLFAAILTDFKDPITLIKAIPLVTSGRDDVVFLIAGDGPLKRNMQKLAEILEVEKSVLMLGVRLDVNILLKLADVFVALSPYENLWSAVLTEAMASGTPCIVTETGSARRFSSSLSQIMYLIPPNDSKRLAQAILNVLGNSTMAQGLSLKALEFVQSNFDMRLTTERLTDVYKKAIECSLQS